MSAKAATKKFLQEYEGRHPRADASATGAKVVR